MDYMEWFPQRVAELRNQKGVSARDMSLSLGQSESYINKIENKHTLPSMAAFSTSVNTSASRRTNSSIRIPLPRFSLPRCWRNLKSCAPITPSTFCS